MTEKDIISLESEIGFRALFQYATIGILVVGQRGTIELVNPNAEKLFGYSSAELIGKPVEVLIPESLHTRHHHHRDSYFEKPKSRPMGQGMDLYARKKDGSVFPVEISLGYYELSGEKLAMAFISDITQRKEAETKLKKMNEDLEARVQERTVELSAALGRETELNEMKSRFVSIASHEFRTPLSAILSSISLIERYANDEHKDKRTKHIERIKSSVHNLTDILNDFLSLDKLEQHKIEVQAETIHLEQFCNEMIEEVSGMLKQGQKINYTHSGIADVFQDKKILRHVLSNLLSNAIKYSPDGKDVQMLSASNDEKVSIRVKDSGIGIPEEEQKNLFHKFFRAKNASAIQGTGLGLNIVQRYMELITGEINFTSKPGEGTEFTIVFPAKYIES